MAIDSKLPMPVDRAPVSIAKRLAYGGSTPPAETHFSYRMERGRPFQRAGKLVSAIPQFKALTIYSPVNSNSPNPSFQTTAKPVAVAYPAKPK